MATISLMYISSFLSFMPDLNKKLSWPPFNDRHNVEVINTDYLTSLENTDWYVHFRFFILVMTSFYLFIVGVEGYCCTWSRSLTHILGRTPLDEGSARRRDLPHNTGKPPMPPAGFEAAIPASERPQTHVPRPRGHWDRRVNVHNSITCESLFVDSDCPWRTYFFQQI